MGFCPIYPLCDVVTAFGWLLVTFRLCPICIMWKEDWCGFGNIPIKPGNQPLDEKGEKRVSIRTDHTFFTLWREKSIYSQKNLLVATAAAKKWKVGTLLRVSNGFQKAWNSLMLLSFRSFFPPQISLFYMFLTLSFKNITCLVFYKANGFLIWIAVCLHSVKNRDTEA